jgi:hypothetical protein
MDAVMLTNLSPYTAYTALASQPKPYLQLSVPVSTTFKPEFGGSNIAKGVNQRKFLAFLKKWFSTWYFK